MHYTHIYNLRKRPVFLHDVLTLLGCWGHFSEYVSAVAGAQLKGNQSGWDFGDRMYSRMGDVLMAATTLKPSGALKCLQ